MTYARRIDANHAKIVKELRSYGVLVVSLAGVGRGVPDILCCSRRKLYLFEIKDGSKKPSARNLTPEQQKFHALWADVSHVILSAEDALKIMGIKKK